MNTITKNKIIYFIRKLREEERATGTIEKYQRDLTTFAVWLGKNPLSKEAVTAWKKRLIAKHYAPTTINSKLAAVNTFLHFLGREDCRVKFLKVQRKLFREPRRELSREEYLRLQETAAALGRERLALV